MGFDFSVIAPLLPSHCGFSCLWMWGIFFGEFQCLPVDNCPAASCDSGVLTRGSESMSFYSAMLVPPSPTRLLEMEQMEHPGGDFQKTLGNLALGKGHSETNEVNSKWKS